MWRASLTDRAPVRQKHSSLITFITWHFNTSGTLAVQERALFIFARPCIAVGCVSVREREHHLLGYWQISRILSLLSVHIKTIEQDSELRIISVLYVCLRNLLLNIF